MDQHGKSIDRHHDSMGHPLAIHVAVVDKLRWPLGGPCEIHARLMGDQLVILGRLMGDPRATHGRAMGDPWDIYGRPMRDSWEIHGRPMDNI